MYQIQRVHMLVDTCIVRGAQRFPDVRCCWRNDGAYPGAMRAGNGMKLGGIEIAILGEWHGLQYQRCGHAEEHRLPELLRGVRASFKHFPLTLGEGFAHCRRSGTRHTRW